MSARGSPRVVPVTPTEAAAPIAVVATRNVDVCVPIVDFAAKVATTGMSPAEGSLAVVPAVDVVVADAAPTVDTNTELCALLVGIRAGGRSGSGGPRVIPCTPCKAATPRTVVVACDVDVLLPCDDGAADTLTTRVGPAEDGFAAVPAIDVAVALC